MILPHELCRAHYAVPGKKLLVRHMLMPDLMEYMGLLGQLSTLGTHLDWLKNFQNLIQWNDGPIIFVAEWRKKVIACATLFIEPKLSHGGQPVAHVEDVVVDKKRRGSGVGQKLVEHLVLVAKHLKCRKVLLACAESNKAFYEKCGFRHTECSMRLDLEPTEAKAC